MKYEWNLYHDMDNRSHNDIKQIKLLETERDLLVKDIEKICTKLSIATAFLSQQCTCYQLEKHKLKGKCQSCGTLDRIAEIV